jgi:vacuolar protein sorting-associated protein 51
LHDSTFRSITEQIKNVLTNLQAFIASDVSFSAKVHFNEPFCKDYVRESLLIPYLKHIASVAKEFSDGSHDPVPYPLLLILTRLCLEFESVSIDYLLTLADEQFFISDKSGLTNKRELSELFKDSAKLLINHYVKVRGFNISQMIRKSVETRDWLNTIEPRNVRAVMKRIVEDLTGIDIQVGELFEAGVRHEKGSDSSRNTFTTRQTQRSSAWSFTPSNADSKLMNNIQKLFAEKIEIFSQVEFSKVSVLTGIVKITLKTLLECIRLKTFSKYGLQQIQVDCHYLQLYLWRFVSDENLVYVLIEEILTSSIHRCSDPQLMEARVNNVLLHILFFIYNFNSFFKVVELICEAN